MAYQSLYRRYRPQKFSEIRGQSHIVAALRNAVANDQVGHAYMFHGPRGTGKTSSARVLAKALNCENLADDSEPCGSCESCLAIEQGRSFDLHELDAASNNGVEDMRELLSKVNLGSPGRMKVYILDEVHMLTRGAENSLLKTLEEPPSHVVWVLATTEPHKVVETIRSRCQVFELGLLGAEETTEHVRWVIADAGLEVDDDAVEYVVSVGGGSVRDTLSALDRVVAAGGAVEIDESTDQLLRAVAAHGTADALTAVGEALGRGRDPRTIGEMVLAGLRDAFLTLMGSPPPRITVAQQERAAQIAEQMSAVQLTRALEMLGMALVEMRQAPDPRVHLEVALVRLCRAVGDESVDALLERVERLESRLADGVVGASGGTTHGPRPVLQSSDPAPPTSSSPPVPTPPPRSSPPAPLVTGSRSQDLRSLQPKSAKEVVDLAASHLSLARNLVVNKANSILGAKEGQRSPQELQRLWIALVDEFGPDSAPDPAALAYPEVTKDPEPAPSHDISSSSSEVKSPDPPEPHDTSGNEKHHLHEEQPVEEPHPTDDPSGVDLDELMDASSHTDQVVELLADAFPGAEVDDPPATSTNK